MIAENGDLLIPVFIYSALVTYSSRDNDPFVGTKGLMGVGFFNDP
jgi:hypothetical protein